jgi:hypothetical protein
METLTYTCRTDGCERQHQAAAGSWCQTCGLPNDPAPDLARTAAGDPPHRAGAARGGGTAPGFLLSLRGQETAVVALAVVVVLGGVVLFATRSLFGFGSSGAVEGYDYQQPYAGEVGDGGDVVTPAAPETTAWSPPTTEPPTTSPPETTAGYPVELAGQAQALASATAPDSVDDAGAPTSYGAENMLDEDPATAWRVEGDGSGATITVTLPGPSRLTQVGLVPGYAKTDPVSGVDRFTQERRITRVSWRFDDGTEVVQRLDDQPTLQTSTVDVTASSVVVEILATTEAGDPDYDYTAISDLSVQGTVTG